MIIRFECDGFKSLRDVVLPLRPFQAFVGPNNAGKSNFFDALRLLSLVPDHDLPEVLHSVRGEPSRLFTQLPDGKDARTMRLAVELLVEPTYLDELEGKVTLSHTRLRYEIEITRDDRADAPTGNAISITSEQLVAIGADVPLPWPSSGAFRQAYVRTGRPRSFISPNPNGGTLVHADRGTAVRTFPNRKGRRQSILSAIRDAGEFPHIAAVRHELRHWRFAQFVPAMLRELDAIGGPDTLDTSGRHLAASLHRIAQDDPLNALEISNHLRQLIPDARRVTVRQLPDYARYLLELEMEDGRRFSSDTLSDGTLRVLAILALLYNPEQAGVILIEEPENGIHPRRVDMVTALLKEAASDPISDDVEPSDPLRQMFITTHSPSLVDALAVDDLILVEQPTLIRGHGLPSVRTTRYRPAASFVAPTDQVDESDDAPIRADLGELWTSGILGGVP